MKKSTDPKADWDQVDYKSRFDTLTTEAASLEAAFKASGQPVPERPVKTKCVVTNVGDLEAHCSLLRVTLRVAPTKTVTATAAQPAVAPRSEASKATAKAPAKSFDDRVREATATRRATEAKNHTIALTLMEKVKSGELSLDAAICQMKSAKTNL